MPKRINWKLWSKTASKIYKKLLDQGIYSCEIRFTGCHGVFFPSLAHSKRRADIYTMDDFEEVILACTFCHSIIDGRYPDPEQLPEKVFWQKDKCTEFVKQKIQERVIW